MTTQRLQWSDVEHAAKVAFSVWVDQPELHWAKKAWQIMLDSGLADYSTQSQRCEAGIRLIALAGIYRDFCEYAWEETSEARWLYSHWAEELEIPSIRIGQLVGRHTDWEDEEEDPEAFESEALRYLVDFERPRVLNVLYDAFGDDINNPVGLFIFLWRSRELPDLDPDDPDYETDEEIVNVPTAGKHAAFEWLAQGCP